MTFKLGAKVMQTVNDYDKNVFNGEIGYITEINERYEGKKKEDDDVQDMPEVIVGRLFHGVSPVMISWSAESPHALLL